jgi:hypothetical protein
MELEGIQEAIRGNVSSKRPFVTNPQSNFKSETKDEKVFNSEMIIWNRKFDKVKDKSKEVCFKCKQRVRYASECKKHSGNIFGIVQLNCNAFSINDSLNYWYSETIGDKDSKNVWCTWLVDSGTARHMSGNRICLVSTTTEI